MPERLVGKTALVTGAGRGFGSNIALRLTREGADVAIHYNRSAQGAAAVAESVCAVGREAITLAGDVTRWDEVKRVSDEVWRRLVRLDVLVNNVGAARIAAFVEVGDEEWDHA